MHSEKTKFKDYILEQVPHANELEVQEILNLFSPRKYKKGEYFIEAKQKQHYLGFALQGPIRTIFYKKDGTEVTARIREENSFIGVVPGFESPIGFQCMGNFTILKAKIEDVVKTLETNLCLNALIRIYATNQIAELSKKHHMFLTASSKERYQMFIKNNPDLLKKFPLRFIASMIGITPTQLSRVRKN